MDFLTANIDRAIVMTQYDLRGFAHPFGIRLEPLSSAKSFDAITANFMAFAAGLGRREGNPTDKQFVSYSKSSYEEYLAMCRRLVEDCDGSQKEAIQLIVQEIVKQNKEMRDEVAAGKREKSVYLQPLEKSNCWGKAVLALAEAFEVKLESVAA